MAAVKLFALRQTVIKKNLLYKNSVEKSTNYLKITEKKF